MLVCSLYNFRILNGTTGLYDRSDSRPGRLIDSIPKWEKSIGCHHSPLGRWMGLLDTYLYRVHPAHLAGPHADRLAILRQDNGIGFDVLDNPPAELQVAPFRLGWLAVRNNLGIRAQKVTVRFLNQDST